MRTGSPRIPTAIFEGNMILDFIKSAYSQLPVPVVVLNDDAAYSVAYANAAAFTLLNPIGSTSGIGNSDDFDYGNLLRFTSTDVFESILGILRNFGSTSRFIATLLDYQGNPVLVSITANVVRYEERNYFAFYLQSRAEDELTELEVQENIAYTTFHMAYKSEDLDESINGVLSFIGASVDVSRVYIFEEISPTLTSNTYEWCAEGIVPCIEDLKNLSKADYNYDSIIENGLYIADDIRELPEIDRAILEEQGIKSVAIIPLIHQNKALGYIGFDDCKSYRKWTSGEINALTDVSRIIISLILRRNAENRLQRGLQILQTISDNIDSVVYVSEIGTNEIIFVNKALCTTLDTTPDQLIGQTCWQKLQSGREGPCEFCPVPKLIDEDGNILQNSVVWEFQNTINKRWYLVKDALIEWIDGHLVHIETTTDISYQKIYEEKLTRYASLDTMTGAYNREWGYKLIYEMSTRSQIEQKDVSLVFIDLDGLKRVNDNFGHSAGDDMITRIVDVIQARVRKSDVVCRWGGDEFIVLLQCPLETAESIMKDVTAKLDQLNNALQLPYKLSISYGITLLNSDEDASIDAIISRADGLMYRNKISKKKKQA